MRGEDADEQFEIKDAKDWQDLVAAGSEDGSVTVFLVLGWESPALGASTISSPQSEMPSLSDGTSATNSEEARTPRAEAGLISRAFDEMMLLEGRTLILPLAKIHR